MDIIIKREKIEGGVLKAVMFLSCCSRINIWFGLDLGENVSLYIDEKGVDFYRSAG